MYEIEEHQKKLHALAEALRQDVVDGKLEGVFVISVMKNNDIEIDSILGRQSAYEWMGMLDYAKSLLLECVDENKVKH